MKNCNIRIIYRGGDLWYNGNMKIITTPDARLREKSEKVHKIDDEILSVISDMLPYHTDHAPCPTVHSPHFQTPSASGDW